MSAFRTSSQKDWKDLIDISQWYNWNYSIVIWQGTLFCLQKQATHSHWHFLCWLVSLENHSYTFWKAVYFMSIFLNGNVRSIYNFLEGRIYLQLCDLLQDKIILAVSHKADDGHYPVNAFSKSGWNCCQNLEGFFGLPKQSLTCTWTLVIS